MEKELQEENGFNQMDTIDMDIDIDICEYIRCQEMLSD